METLLTILILFTSAVCLLYAVLIIFYCYGWLQTEVPASLPNVKNCNVSVIISARNEAQNISTCLSALVRQSCFNETVEIIIVDDHSTDSSLAEVQSFCDRYSNIRLVFLPENCSGKKQAINAGIINSTGELIVTTDADCEMGKDWLQSMINFYRSTSAKMIVAPVCFYKEKTLFEKMQTLEFMALIASGGASLYFNKAILCNGANLAYSRRVFDEVNGFAGVDSIASGDDVLLMYKIKQRYPEGIRFLKQKEAIVFTKAKPDLKAFIQQRKRWSSKGLSFLNMETKFVSILVYLINFMILITFLTSFCLIKSAIYLSFLKFGLIILGIKCIIDFLLLFLASSFFDKKHYLIYFLPEQLIYIIYVSTVGFIQLFGSYEWKGRKIKINEQKRR